MKNKYLILLIVSVLMIPFFSSCSDDEKGQETEKELAISLQGTNYYLLSMDKLSSAKIADKIEKDYRPNGVTRPVYIWADSYRESLCTDRNFYDELQGWRAYSVGTNGWSAVAFHSLEEAEGFDFSGLDESYTLHMAIRSRDDATHAVRFLGSDGQLYGFAIGTQMIEGVEPYTDFERDGEWHAIEVPMRYLFDKGLNYTSAIAQGDMAIFYSGGITGSTLDFDAVFFYKK